MTDERRVPGLPWWWLVTVALLGGALTISVAADRTGDAVIIAVLLVPALVIVAAWLITFIKRSRD